MSLHKSLFNYNECMTTVLGLLLKRKIIPISVTDPTPTLVVSPTEIERGHVIIKVNENNILVSKKPKCGFKWEVSL